MSNGKIIIATHHGRFHADDVFGTAALILYHDTVKDAPLVQILRTRDRELLRGATYKVDVGDSYNVKLGEFDHHQRDFTEVRENGVPYASAGLVWRHVGPEICGQAAADHVDRSLMQSIDAADCGYSLVIPKYDDVHTMTISGLIAHMNPNWDVATEDMANHMFDYAVGFASEILRREITRAKSLLRADDVVREALAARLTPEICVLHQYVPWQTAAVEDPSLLYMVYPNLNDGWMIQAVPEKAGGFESRKPLPEAWRGLRGRDIPLPENITATFVHRNGFIGGAPTPGDAIAMARLAVLV